MEFSPIVTYSLVGIFFAIFLFTAIITICSLPGWINIEEWYKKKLFTALLLEVIGIVILFATDTLNIRKDSSDPIPTPPVYSQYVLQWDTKANGLQVNKQEKEDSTSIAGIVNHSNISNLGLFNSINTTAVDTDDYSVLRFERSNNQWKSVGGSMPNCPFTFEIYYNKDKTKECYRIYKTLPEGSAKDATKDIVYDAAYSSASDVFSSYDRQHHVFEHYDENTKQRYYYIYRITGANTGLDNPFVSVLVLKIKPSLRIPTDSELAML